MSAIPQQDACWWRTEEGDTRARDRLVALYLPLVETLARRFRGSQAEHDDLVQAGSIGLLNAIERYDPERGDEFAAYAVPTVSGEMKRHIRDRGPPSGFRGPSRRPPSNGCRRRGRGSPAGWDGTRAMPSWRPSSRSPRSSWPEPGGAARSARRGSRGAGGAPRTRRRRRALVLAGAFETLDDQEREIVFLRFVEDLDRKEVARRLGISESQLGRRSLRPSRLRSELEDDGLRRAAANAESKPAATPAPRAQASRKAGGHGGHLLLRMPRPLHDDLAEAAGAKG